MAVGARGGPLSPASFPRPSPSFLPAASLSLAASFKVAFLFITTFSVSVRTCVLFAFF